MRCCAKYDKQWIFEVVVNYAVTVGSFRGFGGSINMTISNYQLMQMANEDRIKLIIIMADELVNVKLLPKLNIILNLQDSSKGGSHWVGLVIIDNHAMYFDSYGAGCDQYVITYCRLSINYD